MKPGITSLILHSIHLARFSPPIEAESVSVAKIKVRVGATIRVDFVIVQWKLWEGVGTLARARSRPRQSTAAETAVASRPAATAAFSPRLAPGDTSTVRSERDETTLYHCSVSVRTSLTHSLNVPPNFLTAKNFKGRRFSLVASLSPWNWLFDFHYASVYVLCGMTQSLHSDGAVTHKKLDLEHRMLEKCKTVVTDDNCQVYIPTFSCQLGVYIEGSVSPPLSGVHIRVFAAGDSSITTLKSGELVLETTTGIDGSFVTGPLYDDIGYNVEASKFGYHLKQVAPHSFTCQKLSQISVHIHHKDDSKEPIPSVLLSLSGDNGYRNNSVSGAGRTFLFDNLFPGMFYLRPVLKSKLSGNYVRIVQSEYSESRQRTLDRAYDEIKYLSFGLGVNDERMAEQALTFYKS
ncbi:Nodal modulator 2 [Glycine soja]